MPKSFKIAHVLVLLLVLLPNTSSGRFAASNSRIAVSGSIDQVWVDQDLSGVYQGRIYYGDKTGDQYIMKGPVTLQILAAGKEFVLTEKLTHKTVKGKIRTAVIRDKPDQRVGEIRPDNDDPIDFRWDRDPARNRFRIVRASGVKRVFRFCSNQVKTAQCKIDL